jgi:DNA-binding response OmpR family regulator
MSILILSISYDQALLLTRQLMLEAQGYQVVSALGYKDAEKKCTSDETYRLLVIGHSIPLEDKQALMELFRARARGPVVSLLRRGETLMDGADHHVSPVDPKALVEEIVKTVGGGTQDGHAA